MQALLWITLLSAAIWLALFALSLVRFHRAPAIHPARESSHGPLPAVSVIVPARNEERNILHCLRSLLEQDIDRIEIIVVDDQSLDSTALLVARVARHDRRVRLVQAGELPPGWTGKCHALHQGVAQGRPQGEWLLFTDADTVHGPQSISAALQVALDRKLDLVSLVPHLEARTFWEKLMQPTIAALISLFHRPGLDEAFANGQYILVRRSTYLTAGGHQAVRGRVLEDAELARRVVQAGGRTLLAIGNELFSTRMYTGFRELLEGWTKNLFLIMASRSGLVLGAVLVMWLLSLWPALAGWSSLVLLLAGPAAVPPAWLWLGLGVYGTVLIFQVILRAVNHWYPAYAPLAPLANFLATVICLRSMWRHRRGRGVRWKGRLYHDSGEQT